MLNHMLGTAVDVTESKRADTSLQESEDGFRRFANTVPVMIWMSGPDKLCTYRNWPWLSFTGRSLQQELGNGWTEGVHPDDLQCCWKTYAKAFEHREPFQMEYRIRRHNGEYRWVSDQGAPRLYADSSFAGYIGSCVDVTQRKLSEDALSTMSRKLIEAHEQERTWIARELHDDINQRIALLTVNLERLKQDLPALAPAIAQFFQEIREHVLILGSDVQALSHRLHSSKLEYLGIVSAATSFCKELSEKQEVEINLHSETIPTGLPQAVSLCLFRVLQEALQNAVKHSGSRHFEVRLRATPNEIELNVIDSGNGFDVEEVGRGYGLGLTSMNERLKLVDGELSVNSQPGRGTLIRATVPLPIPNTRAAQAQENSRNGRRS